MDRVGQTSALGQAASGSIQATGASDSSVSRRIAPTVYSSGALVSR